MYGQYTVLPSLGHWLSVSYPFHQSEGEITRSDDSCHLDGERDNSNECPASVIGDVFDRCGSELDIFSSWTLDMIGLNDFRVEIAMMTQNHSP